MSKRLARRLEADPSGPAFWTLIGRRLRIRRTQLGFDVGYVAKRLGISPCVYEGYEAGGVQKPALLLGEIADLFSVPVTWFCQDIAFKVEDEEIAACSDSPGVFKVATVDERTQALTDCFRMLDLEGQQYLLAIAGALSRPS